MKQYIKRYTIAILLFFFLGISGFVFAQDPPPPPPGGATGSTNEFDNRNGGGAPIGSGLIILLALGAGYGARKVYAYRKKKKAE